MPTYLTPGVYFEKADTGRGIRGLRTDIAALIGIAERGPLHWPTPVNSWEQFHTIFGDFIANGYLAYAAKAFFENGGRLCYIVRVAAATASAARADLLGEDGLPTLHVEAASPGTWGDGVAVRVTRSSRAATSTAGVAQPAGGVASFVRSTVGFAPGSLVKVFQDGPPPANLYRVVTAVDQSRKLLRWNAPLAPDLNVLNPLSFETMEFGLTVYRQGRIREVFSGLSLIEDHASYVGKVITSSSSQLIRISDPNPIRIEDLGVGPLPFPSRLPDLDASNSTRGSLWLAGGRDGLAALQPEDFTGDRGAVNKWGLRTLEDVDEVAIVAVPDILIQPAPPTLFAPLPPSTPDPCLPDAEPPIAPPIAPPIVETPPVFSPDQVFFVQQALVEHCATQRDRIAVLDAPVLSQQPDGDIGEIQSWRLRFDSRYAALYYPWVLVYDPLHLGGQVVRAIPPSGHVAGLFARTDLERGVHEAPANRELQWAQAAVTEVSDELQGVLNPLGINCIRAFPGRGLRLYGARTLSSDASWRYVNVRRLLMMIEEAVEESIQWAVFEPNDFYLRETVALATSNFLQGLWRRGALVGAQANQAFFVKCDTENNPPSVVALGQLIVEVGVAPVKPAEFVIFRIGRTEDELEILELGEA